MTMDIQRIFGTPLVTSSKLYTIVPHLSINHQTDNNDKGVLYQTHHSALPPVVHATTTSTTKTTSNQGVDVEQTIITPNTLPLNPIAKNCTTYQQNQKLYQQQVLHQRQCQSFRPQQFQTLLQQQQQQCQTSHEKQQQQQHTNQSEHIENQQIQQHNLPETCHHRQQQQTALVPMSTKDAPTLAGQLLYAATHTDETQRRRLANLITHERLYRKLFCGEMVSPKNDGLAESLITGDRSFIKYRNDKRPMNLQTLCEHIEELIQAGYSLTYIFVYLSYLRKKYRETYPRLYAQTPIFYRTLIQKYEEARKCIRRKNTDEVYTCEESIYHKMFDLAWTYYTTVLKTVRQSQNNQLLLPTATNINGTITEGNVLFYYIFIFMYLTGKRLSDLALITMDHLRQLQQTEMLVIRIPKSKKLGRITMRDYDVTRKTQMHNFLQLTVEMFDEKSPYAQTIPFDQYKKRRTLDRNFKSLYDIAVRDLTQSTDSYTTNIATNIHSTTTTNYNNTTTTNDNAIEEQIHNPPRTTTTMTIHTKPRGLSLHSLRRFVAASLFRRGCAIETIRECLDHSSTRVTNTYINRHLMQTYRAYIKHPPSSAAASSSHQ